MAARAAPRGPLRPPCPDRARPLARRPVRRLQRQDRGARQGRLPHLAVARPGRRQRARSAADRREQERHDAALVPGRAAWPSSRIVGRSSRPAAAARSPARPEAPKEGGTQVWLLPFADGGEARQLTDLPKDVEGAGLVARRRAPRGRQHRRLDRAGEEARAEARRTRPTPDTRLIDTLGYQFNGAGFVHDRFTRLWLVDADERRGRAADDAATTTTPTRSGRPTAARSRSSPTATRTRTSAGAATSTSSTSATRGAPAVARAAAGRAGARRRGRRTAAGSPPSATATGGAATSMQASVWRFRVRDGYGREPHRRLGPRGGRRA